MTFPLLLFVLTCSASLSQGILYLGKALEGQVNMGGNMTLSLVGCGIFGKLLKVSESQLSLLKG